MSLQTLERVILASLRWVLLNPKIRKADILEWSTSEDVVKANAVPEDVVVYIEDPGVWCALNKRHDKRVSTKPVQS